MLFRVETHISALRWVGGGRVERVVIVTFKTDHFDKHGQGRTFPHWSHGQLLSLNKTSQTFKKSNFVLAWDHEQQCSEARVTPGPVVCRTMATVLTGPAPTGVYILVVGLKFAMQYLLLMPWIVRNK